MSETERDRSTTPHMPDPCVFCGRADTVFLMAADEPFPSSKEIELAAVLLKTCVIAPRWRWCWREQRLLGALRSRLDERFAAL